MIRGMLWVGLIAVTLSACAPATRVGLPATMSVDPQFSAEDTEAIFAAADAWSAATNGIARLEVSVGDGGAIRLTSEDSNGTEMGGTLVLDERRADIHIDVGIVADQAKHVDHVSERLVLQDTVMHELGHAFGLDHVDGGLMDPKKYNGCFIDADTLRRFCGNYDCR